MRNTRKKLSRMIIAWLLVISMILQLNYPVRISQAKVKNGGEKEIVKQEEKTPQLNRIMEECEEVKEDSGKIKKGQRMYSQSVVSVEVNNATQMAITLNGDLYCWGYNFYGQVGNGSTEDQTTPVKVLENVETVLYSISNNDVIVSAITENGDLYCWGKNCAGEVGNGSTKYQTTPVKVLENVETVSYSISSCSDYRSVTVSAITENGDLYCWGDNMHGQVGNGSTEDQTTPVKVLENVETVLYSSDSDGTVSAITENGDLYCWGYNRNGEVGNGSTEDQRTPVKVLENVKTVSYSNSRTVSAITENGDLYCWGDNMHGQVGNGSMKDQLTPVKVLENVKTVSYSDDISGTVLAITENGDLYCWGYNKYGEVGNGSTENQLTPVKVLENVKTVSYSSSRTVSAITENGNLYCWGYNFYGLVGNGSTEDQRTPVKVLENVKTVLCDSVIVSAITENGDLYCWGDNINGEVGNGSTEDQRTPVKVLENVKTVSYGGYGTVSAITENGDLYCWGYNRNGEVGNGTYEDQLTPVMVLGSSLSQGLDKNGCLQLSIDTTVIKGKSKYITGKAFADNSSELKKLGDSLTWKSANPSVITVGDVEYFIPHNENIKEMYISAKITSISYGETDIYVSAPDGSVVRCHVTVVKPPKSESEDDDYSLCFSVAGELQKVDDANKMVKIDGIDYIVQTISTINHAKEIFEQYDNKMVACKVRVSDNKIERLDSVKDIIGKPSVNIKPEVDNINYEKGKFNKKSFNIDLELYCGVKWPYSISDISDVIKKIDGLEVDLKKILVSTSHNNSGEIPFLLKEGVFGSQDIAFEKALDFKLKPGKIKKIRIQAYVKENLVIEDVNYDAEIKAEINDGETSNKEVVHISNVDKAREVEQNKLANSYKTPELQNINDILNGSNMGYDDTALRNCLTDIEVKAIAAQVNNWIYTSNALNSIIEDDSDNSFINKLLKKCGLTKEKFKDEVLKRLGIDEKIVKLLNTHPYEGTLQFEAKDKNTGKDIKIKFTSDMDFYGSGVGNSSYAGFGTLKYKISNGGSGTGLITFTNYDAFVKSILKIWEGQVHKCYNQYYGNGINWIAADNTVSSTFDRLVNAKYGSYGEFVYTSLKYAYTGYTEEDAKKSIKDVVIILKKDFVNRKTKVSLHCPVDVVVYDGDGNICAEIKDDTVNEKYQDVPAYVNGDDKYFILPDSDYVIQYNGNDTGTMTYTITEYENDEVVRELTYNNVPLTAEKKYVNYLTTGRHQGVALYNLTDLEGGVIKASSDIDKMEESVSSVKSIELSDKKLSLEKGQSYILMETILPSNTVSRNITWSSSNDDVVEVNNSGILYAKADGEAVITVKINGRNLSDSCVVTVGEKSASPAPEVTGKPDGTQPSVNPTIPTESAKPSYTNVPIITSRPSGVIIPSYTNAPVITPKPNTTATPSPSPVTTSKPIVTETAVVTPTPESTPTITETVAPSIKPSEVPEENVPANSNSKKKLKKGDVVKDKKSKAKYKILNTSSKKASVEYTAPTNKKLKKIVIPETVTIKNKKYRVTKIGEKAFAKNKNITTVKIGNNINAIGKKAFEGCSKLNYIVIGKNVSKISEKAFNKCKNLHYIQINTKKLTLKNTGKDAFANGYGSPRVKSDKSVWEKYSRIFSQRGISAKTLYIINPVKLII